MPFAYALNTTYQRRKEYDFKTSRLSSSNMALPPTQMGNPEGRVIGEDQVF